jgi:hypothetical protein
MASVTHSYDESRVYSGPYSTMGCVSNTCLIHYPCIIKFTFPLNLDLISRKRYVLIVTLCVHVSVRVSSLMVLTSRTVDRYTHEKTTKKVVNSYGFGAVPIYTIFRDFGWSVFAPISSMHYSTSAHLLHMQ